MPSSNARLSLADLNIQGTVTGRISSHAPATVELAHRSNVPKSGDGMCLGLLNLDFSDIERRVAAHQPSAAEFPYGR